MKTQPRPKTCTPIQSSPTGNRSPRRAFHGAHRQPTGAEMPDILTFVLLGFLAQIVDGELGMAFGVITTSVLLTLGLPPAPARAMTHITEIFTTAASGTSHVIQRTVDWRFVARLAPAGMLGGAIGAYLLSSIDAG